MLKSMTKQEANDIIDAFAVAWQKAGIIRDARLLPESKQRLYEAFGQEITRLEKRKKIDPVSFREDGFEKTLDLLAVGWLAIPEFQRIDPEDEAVIAQINSGQATIDRTNIEVVDKYSDRHTAELEVLIGRLLTPTNPVDLEGQESSNASDGFDSLIDEAAMIGELLHRYIDVHNRIFKPSLRHIIPIPGIFKRIDYQQHFESLRFVEMDLEPILSNIAESPLAAHEFAVALLAYGSALHDAIVQLREICGNLFQKADGTIDYTRGQYKQDLSNYHESVGRYRQLGVRVNEYFGR